MVAEIGGGLLQVGHSTAHVGASDSDYKVEPHIFSRKLPVVAKSPRPGGFEFDLGQVVNDSQSCR